MINPNAAVVLSGGGAYAAYEIGIMRAVFSGESFVTLFQPLNPGIFTGTSAGALNASVMTSQPGTDLLDTLNYLEAVWKERFAQVPSRCGNGVYRIRLDPVQFLKPECLLADPTAPLRAFAEDFLSVPREFVRRGANFLLSTGSLQSRALELVDLPAFISNDALPQTLREVVDLEGIRNSDRQLKVAATNWDTGGVKLFGNQEFTDDIGYLAIQASTAIPGVFAPVQIQNTNYVDGGLVMNSPLKPALDLGATELHVVYMDPNVKNIPITKLQNTIDVFDRALMINFAERANNDIATARKINEGLDAIQKLSSGAPASPSDDIAVIRVANQIQKRIDEGAPYRKLTIHRYHPTQDLGGGLGILDFSPDTIQWLIERGYQDGLRHNCLHSECVLAQPLSSLPIGAF
jgi:NTE family protein